MKGSISFTFEVLKKAGEALIPSIEDLPHHTDKEFYRELETFTARIPAYAKLFLKISTIILQLLPLLRIFKLKKPAFFTSLSVEERAEILSKLSRNRFYLLRAMYSLIRIFAIVPYVERDDVKKAVEYEIEIVNRKIKSPKPVEENLIEISNPEELTQNPFKIRCQILVIGSGAGGSVVAKELAENGFDVVVVEEGFRPDCDKQIGRLFSASLLYRDGGFSLTFSPPGVSFQPFILLPQGEALGGTTVVNSGTCFRVPDSVLEKWTEELGIPGISPEDMKPYFERVEKILNVHPVSVNLMGLGALKIAEGAEKLRYSYFPLNKNSSGCVGTGICQLCCPIDAKRTAHLTFIPLATQHGAKFYTGFRVKWLEFRGRRITKVGGEIINRRREVIGKFVVEPEIVVLATGAIQTPYILLKNGVANSSGMVGRNLHIHPALAVTGILDENIYGWRGVSQSLCIDEFAEEGILLESSMPPLSLGIAATPLIGNDLSQLLLNWKKVSVCGVMISESDSGGKVMAFPDWIPYFGMYPLILYKIGRKDKRKAVKGVVEACRIFISAGARRVITPFPDFPVVKNRYDLERLERVAEHLHPNRMIWSAYHPHGTCRMSVDPTRGVVDPYCKTHDFENLYIADASVFPGCIKVNPMISIMAFAARTADYIAEVKL